MPRREDNVDPVWLVVRDRTGLDLDAAAWAGRPVAERFARAMDELRAAGAADRLDEGEAWRLARVIEANVEALYAYRPRPLDGRVLFFRAAERRRVDPPRPELPWIELARGGAETVVVPGDHESMHKPPHVETMARHLADRLEAARRAPAVRRR
jgi:thioesterase domain-containing protein